MLKSKWSGTRHPLFLVGFKENRKALATLTGFLEQRDILHPMEIMVLKADEIPEFPPSSVVAFSFFSPRWEQVKRIIEANGNREIFFVGGGPHPAGRWYELLKERHFNVVFRGEGEIAFMQFIEFLQGRRKLEEISGICFIADEEIRCNPVEHLKSLDLSPGYTDRFNYHPAIEITRGCPYLCQYCQTPQLMGRRPRHRSITNLLQIIDLYLHLGKRDFRFITPNAFGYMDPSPGDDTHFTEMVKQLSRKISGRGRIFIGSFPSEVRPEYVTPTKLKMVRNHWANDNIVLGAQSGSNRILKKMKRAHTIEDVINAVEIITGFGLIANVDFIFGNPGETEEDIEATIWLMNRLLEMGARIHGHYFMPLPGTPWEKEKPTRWHDRYIRILGEMSRNGKLYGSWSNQMRLAERLAH